MNSFLTLSCTCLLSSSALNSLRYKHCFKRQLSVAPPGAGAIRLSTAIKIPEIAPLRHISCKKAAHREEQENTIIIVQKETGVPTGMGQTVGKEDSAAMR